jgi:hypothetical protein
VCNASTSGGPKRSIAAARIVAGTSGAIRVVGRFTATAVPAGLFVAIVR